MRAFMTVGTLRFLESFIDKHPEIDFYFMNNMYEKNTLVYYEHEQKKVFAAGKTYDIIFSQGQVQEKGYVSLETIPVTVDSQPLFKEQVRQQKLDIEQMPGFYAFRLLKPRHGNDYILLSQWQSETYFEQWEENKREIMIKQPAYFASRPFSASYVMVDFDN